MPFKDKELEELSQSIINRAVAKISPVQGDIALQRLKQVAMLRKIPRK